MSLRACDGEINCYTKSCIESQKVYFNDWEKLNDPMEGFYMYIPSEHIENIEEILHKSKTKYKIFCCSKEYSSILLWSHYADSHKGICVEVEMDEDLCRVNDIFKLNIVYRKNLVDVYPKDNTRDNVKHILKHKLSVWGYEEEVRFFKESDQPNSFGIGEIKSIFLGTKCSEKDEAIIKEWIKHTSIEIKKVDFDLNSNQMAIKD